MVTAPENVSCGTTQVTGKVWALMLSRKHEYVVHSFHAREDVCREWQRCKEVDGDDTAIAVMDREQLEEFLERIA